MAFHKDEAGLSLHALHAFTFATAVERVAGTGYAITAADIGKVAKQTDTNRFYLLVNNSPLTWSEVTAPGGSGGINYVSNDGAEDSAGSWATYADAAAVSPVDGTGGSANITLTRTTSNPLRSNASFLITKDAVNRQGQGISFDFTIDRADEAKPLAIEFDYEPLSGFVAGSDSTNSDLVVYIYDLDYSTLIQPTPFKLVGGVGSKHKFISEFQSSAASAGVNARKYRLIFHVATTNASAWTFKFDGVRVGPKVTSYGSPITDWQTYSPVLSGATNGLTFTNQTTTGKYRRNGDSLELQIYTLFSGAPGTGTGDFNWSLPNGLIIDTSKLAASSQEIGGAVANDTGVARTGDGATFVASSTQLRAVSATGAIWSATAPYTFGNTDTIVLFNIKIPIVGWSSTVEMSNDTSTRVTFAEVRRTTAQASQAILGASAPVKIQLGGITRDTHNGYSTVNYRYTVQEAGIYQFNPNIVLSNTPSNGTAVIFLYKNGVNIKTGGTTVTTVGTTSATPLFTDYAVAGDYYELFIDSTVDVDILSEASVTGGSTWNIVRISGPTQIAASELIAAKYYRAATQASVGNPIVTILYDTTIFDTHGAFNPSNGRFTAPVAGIYNFLVQFYAGLSNDGQRKSLRYRINGAGTEPYIGQVASIGAASADRGFAGFNVKLNAGDYVEIRFESTANVDINGGIINNIVDVYKLR